VLYAHSSIGNGGAAFDAEYDGLRRSELRNQLREPLELARGGGPAEGQQRHSAADSVRNGERPVPHSSDGIEQPLSI
jgi:hypothetical protein